MQNTEKYKFLLPEGTDYYDEGDQNVNWQEVEKLLAHALIGGTSKIERLPDGSIKITYTDGNTTIYHPMNENGDVVRDDYDKNGALIDEIIENAMQNLAGVNLRIDALLADLNGKYLEIMGLLWNAAVKYDITSDIVPVSQTWLNRETNQIRVNRSDGTYSIFTRQPNGSTTEDSYNASGKLLSSTPNVRFERDFIRTNVKIAQMEKDLAILKAAIQDEWITLYAYQFSLVNGSAVDQSGRRVVQVTANGGAVRVMGTKAVSVTGGTYSCTIRCKSSMKVSVNLIAILVTDANNRTLANVTINGSNFTDASMFYAFSFAFCTKDNFSSQVTIKLQTCATGGSTPVITFDSVRLKQISTGIGSSPNSVTL